MKDSDIDKLTVDQCIDELIRMGMTPDELNALHEEMTSSPGKNTDEARRHLMPIMVKHKLVIANGSGRITKVTRKGRLYMRMALQITEENQREAFEAKMKERAIPVSVPDGMHRPRR